jgi:hypothetical protein
VSQAGFAQHHTRKAKKKPVAQVQQQPQPAPVPPPPPPTPEQLPAVPPKLTFQNGQLTIVAQNSTLGDILRDVHSKTGATIDVPGAAAERVVGQFGPGSPRDVLATLLNGSHFNYVMVGTPSSPDSVAQVILTPKTGGETAPAPSASTGGQPGMMSVQPPVTAQPFPPRTFPQPQASAQVDAQDQSGTDSAEENTDDTTAQDQDAGENGDEGAPEQANQGEAGQNPNQPVVKTPEQLLQELQRQQQIMQQQQQGQNQGQQPVQPQVYPIPQPQPPQQEK